MLNKKTMSLILGGIALYFLFKKTKETQGGTTDTTADVPSNTDTPLIADGSPDASGANFSEVEVINY